MIANRPARRGVAVLVAGAVAIANGALLLLASGRFDSPALWSYAIVWTVFLAYGAASADPDLVEERLHPGPGRRESLPLLACVAGLLWLAHLWLAAVDIGRFHWSYVPAPLRVIGFAGLIASFFVMQAATRANPFFSSVVRIQADRGHRVISTGPYGIVRHPGYAGVILMLASSALALGSWVSFVPGVLATVALMGRALFEEAVLRRELPGYEDYTRRVRHRLLPGVW